MTVVLPPEAEAVFVAGLRWIYDTEQPAGALLEHHGYSRRAGEVTYGFCPRGYDSLPVVVVNRVGAKTDNAGNLINPLTPEELIPITLFLDRVGHPAATFWNAAEPSHNPCESGSFGLGQRAHQTLFNAVGRYLAGCLRHNGSVFCGTWQDRADSTCRWWKDGHALAVMPTWPEPATA